MKKVKFFTTLLTSSLIYSLFGFTTQALGKTGSVEMMNNNAFELISCGGGGGGGAGAKKRAMREKMLKELRQQKESESADDSQGNTETSGGLDD